MPIAYPLTLPAEFKSAEISFAANAVVGMAESPFTLVQEIQESQGQRIEAVITLPAMKRDVAEPVVSFLLKLNASKGTFYCGDRANKKPRGVATGAPKVNGIATAFSNDLVTDGWTPSTVGILKAGDWVQIGTGSTRRLHKVLDDVNSDGGGNASLLLWPRVRSAYADNTDIVVQSATGVFRLRQITEWSINVARVYGLTVPIVEDLW